MKDLARTLLSFLFPELGHSNLDVHPLTLAFQGAPGQEARFQAHQGHRALLRLRSGLLVTIIIYGAMGVLDTILVPETIGALWIIRYLFVLPLLFVIGFLSVRTDGHRHLRLAALAVPAVPGLGIAAMALLLPPPVRFLYPAALIVLVMVGYLLVPLSIADATAMGWALTVVFLLVAGIDRATPLDVVVAQGFLLGSGNLLGMAAAYRRELGARTRYAEDRQRERHDDHLARAHAAIERRLADREAAVRDAEEELRETSATLHQTADALRTSEYKHRRMVSGAPVGLLRVDSGGYAREVNASMAALLQLLLGSDSPDTASTPACPAEGPACPAEGPACPAEGPACPAGDSEGAPLHVLSCVPLVEGGVAEDLATCLTQGRTVSSVRAVRSARGRRVHLRCLVYPLLDPSGRVEAAQAIVERIDDQVRLEQEFCRAQKLQAVSLLAGGVAHEFNDFLAVIDGFAQMSLAEAEPGTRLHESLQEIRAAVQRAARVTRELLSFSRSQVQQSRVMSLNDVLRAMDRLLPRLVGESIRLEVRLAEDLWPVEADPGQFEQVVVHLARNAADAMPQGGDLVLETANLPEGDVALRRHPDLPPGPYVLMAITDTGTGIRPEVQHRLFEPFFTTKSQGQGTGLGMAAVYGIVRQSSGSVIIDSSEGHGARVEIVLPRATEDEGADLHNGSDPALPRGSETLLVVEDQARLRLRVARILQDLGYRVLQAGNAREAVQAHRQEQGRVDLVISGVVMVGATGLNLALQLRALQPDIGVLYLSTYAPYTLGELNLIEPGARVVRTPLQPEELARAVRDALEPIATSGPRT